MTETEKLLTEYNINPKNVALIDYYHQENMWKSLGIERDENRHSAFIKWLLEKDFDDVNAPISKFLNLLIRYEKNHFDSTLRKAILKKKLHIKAIEISTEKRICDLSVIRYTDRVDIYINCEVDGVVSFNKVEIIIENKVDATEGGPKKNNHRESEEYKELTPEEKEYAKKHQTKRYYYALCAQNGLRKPPYIKDKTVQLFVFITAREQNALENNFITVTYQDLVDYVIQPYLKSNTLDEHTKFMLNDYLRILGNPYNENMTTMAITQEEKELLVDFYNDNIALFKKALEVMRSVAIDTNDIDGQEDIKNIITAIEKKRPKRQFIINGQGNSDKQRPYTMYEAIVEYVKFRLQSGEDIDSINTEINEFIRSKRINIDRDKTKVFQYKKGVTEALDDKSRPFFITHQWAADEKGFFTRFSKGVNQKYEKKFIIESV